MQLTYYFFNLLDYTRRARVAPKRLFVSGEPKHIYQWRILTLYIKFKSKILPITCHKFADFSKIERDRKAWQRHGDPYGRTNIDFCKPAYTKSPFRTTKFLPELALEYLFSELVGLSIFLAEEDAQLASRFHLSLKCAPSDSNAVNSFCASKGLCLHPYVFMKESNW